MSRWSVAQRGRIVLDGSISVELSYDRSDVGRCWVAGYDMSVNGGNGCPCRPVLMVSLTRLLDGSSDDWARLHDGSSDDWIGVCKPHADLMSKEVFCIAEGPAHIDREVILELRRRFG